MSELTAGLNLLARARARRDTVASHGLDTAAYDDQIKHLELTNEIEED